MSPEEYSLLNECRLCEARDVSMHSVFHKVSGGKQVLQLIKECLPIPIYRTDPLSKQVCDMCYTHLIKFDLFKTASIENFEKQKERLRRNLDVKNTSVQLYLNSLRDNINCDPIEELTPSTNNHQDKSLNTHQKNEVELNDQLQKAIEDFMKRKQGVQNSDEVINGTNNEPNSFTMDLAHKRLRSSKDSSAQVKKRRLFGPKSTKEKIIKNLYDQALSKKRITRFNPVSLMKCALNSINKQNVPAYVSEYGTKSEADLLKGKPCRLCNAQFNDALELAKHETEHIVVTLGDKTDNAEIQCESSKPEKKVEDNVESVLARQSQQSKDLTRTDVVLVNTKAMVCGTLLSDIPKDRRRVLYKSVTIEGSKRKFCPLCRYIFKDNWSMELHYFSSACYYTCRFCGFRFNNQKLRPDFDLHVKNHIIAGDKPNTRNVYLSKKGQDKPRVVSDSKMTARIPEPRVYSRKPKEDPVDDDQESKNVQIKQEKENGEEVPAKDEANNDGQKGSQAYFCRKCYQVFFKLDEYDIHVLSCKGPSSTSPRTRRTTNVSSSSASPNRKPATPANARSDDEDFETEPRILSPAGRPVRHCVKETGAYFDDTPDEVLEHMRRPPKLFPCNMCNSSFSTVYSRNSHMRVHKEEIRLRSLDQKSIKIQKPTRRNNVAKRINSMIESPSFGNYYDDMGIKQEPMEPLVEIHEQPSSFPSNIGSVSITPIPNASKRTNLDPNIMRLVQNNPNLTIKTMGHKQRGSSNQLNYPSPSDNQEERTFRCSGCSKPFLNKSLLYQHKKSNCGGSKYPCPFCKKRFGTESAYSSHIFYNHAE